MGGGASIGEGGLERGEENGGESFGGELFVFIDGLEGESFYRLPLI